MNMFSLSNVASNSIKTNLPVRFHVIKTTDFFQNLNVREKTEVCFRDQYALEQNNIGMILYDSDKTESENIWQFVVAEIALI